MSEQRYYFDTSIWIDIYEKRGYHGEVAKSLMEKIILEDGIVIYSDIVVLELKKLGFGETEIRIIFSVAESEYKRLVYATKDQIRGARKLAKQRDVPLRDVLHAILARDHEAQLVSRDKDFEKLRDITRCKLPEDLI